MPHGALKQPMAVGAPGASWSPGVPADQSDHQVPGVKVPCGCFTERVLSSERVSWHEGPTQEA